MGVGILSVSGFAATASQDIMMLPLYKAVDAKYRVDFEPINVTQREGYDNQPKFAPDGKSIYFTRMLNKSDGEGQQADIFKFDIEKREAINITQTEDSSEYSATPYNKDFISVVGVNSEGEQHLKLVNLQSKEQEALRADIEPVGYYAWLTPTKAGVFVLGDEMTLRILDTESEQEAITLESNIGRTLETVAPHVITFTKEIDGVHHMYALTADGAITSLEMSLPEGVQDYVWLDSNRVIVGKNSKLLLVGSANTKELADLTELGVSDITRLALSPDKSKLAIVYERQ